MNFSPTADTKGGEQRRSAVRLAGPAGAGGGDLSEPTPKEVTVRPHPAVVLSSIALAALAGAARAQYPERSRWEPTVRLFGSFADASGEDFDTFASGSATRFELSSGTAFGVSYEFRLRHRFGIEVGLSAMKLDMAATLDYTALGGPVQHDSGSITFIPLTAAFNVHLLRGGKADLYLGPVVGYVNGSKESFPFNSLFGFPFTLEVEGSGGGVVGGQLGLDFTFGKSGWGFGLRVRSLGDLGVEEQATTTGVDVEIKASALEAGIGLVRRF